jgi:hypothetical protein
MARVRCIGTVQIRIADYSIYTFAETGASAKTG